MNAYKLKEILEEFGFTFKEIGFTFKEMNVEVNIWLISTDQVYAFYDSLSAWGVRIWFNSEMDDDFSWGADSDGITTPEELRNKLLRHKMEQM